MTVTNLTVKKTFNGDGSTTQFNIPFEFISGKAGDQLKVFLIDVGGNETAQLETTHWNFVFPSSPIDDPTAIDMLIAPLATETLRLERVLPFQQVFDLSVGQFKPETYERALDSLLMMIQQLADGGVGGGGGSDSFEVKISSNDNTSGFLDTKLIAGTNITLTENNDGGNETLTIDASGGGITSPLTTKGDLFTFDTDDQRLPVGSNGQLLSANSAEATGLEWINAPSGSDSFEVKVSSNDSTESFLEQKLVSANNILGITTLNDGADEDLQLAINEANITHQNISGAGTNTHAQIDSHIADATLHFTEASIDHTNIQNIGTNTHAQIDAHIAATNNPHSVDIDDVTPTTTKGDIIVEDGTNAIRLGVGTDGQVLVADSAEASGLKWDAASGGVSDHGALTGLADDDHTQYHTDARALTWLGTRSTTDLPEGTNLYFTSARFDTDFAAKSTTDLSEGTNLYWTQARFDAAFAAEDTDGLSEGATNLYFTDERAQDAVGTILTDSSTIDFTYNDAGNTITASTIDSAIDHDALLNFVANEHIDHTSVTLTAGSGLSGGGDISANRTFDVDINSETDTVITASDEILFSDASDSNNIKKDTVQGIIDLVSAGSGDVVGPASATDNALVRWDGTTGKLVKDSNAILSNDGDLTGVNHLEVVGASVPYTSKPPPFVDVSQDHEWDFSSVVFPPAFFFSGTQTLLQSGNLFGMGFLFHSTATLKNDALSAANVTSFYTLAAQNTFQADGQSISSGFMIEVLSDPKYTTINGGSYTPGTISQFQSQGTIDGATVAGRKAFAASDFTVTSGALTGQAGLASQPLNSATNNTHVLMGQSAIPTGNFGIYQAQAYLNRWNAGHNLKVNNISAALTLNRSHHVINCTSNTFTVTLPAGASSVQGREYIINNEGTGTITIARNGSNIAGSASNITLVGANTKAVLIYDGSNNWMRIV